MMEFAIISLLAWVYLALLHGQFWRDGPALPSARPAVAPPVAIIVPARDEADMVARSVGSLLAQDYPGAFRVVLVDDGSTDGTAEIAAALPGAVNRLAVLHGTSRPAGWAGKLWAVHQGVGATTEELILLTDADIVHAPGHLSALVAGMAERRADMASEMVALNCESPAERMLVPAFVYFFAMLYPFSWVNQPRADISAAAGGTILIKRSALMRVGGIAAIRGALIDDVALARAVKREGRIWIGHSALARSVRPYPHFADIWRMIARSAYVQLGNSPAMLAVSLVGLALLFLLPPIAALLGSTVGWLAWGVMSATFIPTLLRFRRSLLWAPLLPAIAAFYMAATVGSAIDHHRGRGVVWKNRSYGRGEA